MPGATIKRCSGVVVVVVEVVEVVIAVVHSESGERGARLSDLVVVGYTVAYINRFPLPIPSLFRPSLSGRWWCIRFELYSLLYTVFIYLPRTARMRYILYPNRISTSMTRRE